MLAFIMTYWSVIPSVIAVASVIAKITKNETDNKAVYYAQKFFDVFALTTGKTVLKPKNFIR